MMNYVGSISILDRGDAPAQAILDKNARSLAQRVADETKEELEKVMTRVETIYESYEQSTQALYDTHSSLEYVEDIAELEELLKDQVKKKKYQQQVTIFVVGYENVCGQRLKLLQQVNEFFMDNSKSYEEEDWYPSTPDVDLDDVSQKIEDSLETAGELAQRLGQLNQEMVDWLSNYAITKASNKGKKKLEKALTQAKDDISGLSEKLLGVQTELEEKDEKLQNMLRNLEIKSNEVQKFKTAADVAKKTIEDLEKADKKMKDDMALQNAMIKEMRSKLSEAKIDLSHTKYMKDVNTERLQHTTSETQARLDELQRQVDNNKAITEEQKRDLQKLHEKQLLDLHQSHNKDIEEIRNQCAEELKTAQEEIEKVRERLVQAENLAQTASEEADLMRQSLLELQLRASSAGSKPVITDTDGEDLEESRPSTKDTKSSRQSLTNKTSGVRSQAVKVQQKLPTKTELKSQSKSGKETSEIAVQDEGGDPTSAQVEEVKKPAKKSKSTLETVQENETEFPDQFDLKDNEAWANIPPQQLSGRFLQYRKLTVKKLEEIEEQLNLTKVKTQRKVQTLKSQFQEHKGKWEAERKVLVEQISQAQKMQTEAEKEADAAMSQLEDFINEQERLENEEENKRQEVTNEINSSAHVRKMSVETPKTEPEKSVPPTPVTREASSDIHTQSPPQLVQSEDSENELQRLMQQTDDAKTFRQKSDSIISSADLDAEVAPWLLEERRRQSIRSESGDLDDEKRRSSSSKTSLRTRERLQSELTKLTEPDENEEIIDQDEGTDDAKALRESSLSRKSLASKERKSVSRRSFSGRDNPTPNENDLRSRRGSSHISKHSPDKDHDAFVEEIEKAIESGGEMSRKSSDKSEIIEDSLEFTDDQVVSSHVSRRGSESRKGTVVSFKNDIEDGSGSRRTGLSKRGRSEMESRKGSLSGLDTTLDNEDLFLEDVLPLESSMTIGDDSDAMEISVSIRNRQSANPLARITNEPVGGSQSRRGRTAPELMMIKHSDDLAQEMKSRHASGAMSAPPAVEPVADGTLEEEAFREKIISGAKSPRIGSLTRENIKSQSFHRGISSNAPIEEISEAESGSRSSKSKRSVGSAKSDGQIHKDAWRTPRTPRTSAASIRAKSANLPPTQESAVENMKMMLEEENLSSLQLRTLESVRSALQEINEAPKPDLTEVQLERTLTLISLASQLTEESLQLGVLPESVFDAFASLNSRCMSKMSHGEDNYTIEDTPYPVTEYLRPLTRDSINTSDEHPTATSFHDEFSHTDLKALRVKNGLLSSSQSLRTNTRERTGIPSVEREQKLPSAPLNKSRRLSHPDVKELTFTSWATAGSSPAYSVNTYTPGSRHKSRSQRRRSEFDVLKISQDVYFGGEANNMGIAGVNKVGVLMKDKSTLTDPKMAEGRSETMPVAGLNDEEGRVISAKSRASLRSQYRNKLEEARSAAEDRRSKSPAISVPSVRSLEEDQLVEEEDDEDIPVTDEFKVDIKEKEREITMDVGTSPPPTKEQRRSVSMSRQSLAIADHPAVLEYLKIYSGLVNFRDALSKIMVDKEMLQFGQILADLDTVKFEKEAQVFPQLEKMTTNVYYLLEEMTDMLNNLLIADREPVVSSMMMLSRDPSQKTLLGRESGESGRAPPQSVTGRYSTQPEQSSSEDKEAIRELQIHCEDLQHQLIEESRKHEQQLKHNTVVMMEMQDTINELQRELAALGRASSRMRQISDNGPGQVPDSAIMFTRLDSERNSKIMKRAVNDDKLDAEKYKDAVNKMDDYVSLPAQRLAHLVRKYVHHCRMKEIEENVKKSRSLNENVFEILDKMEALQNQRAKKWADKMDEMGSERLRLASLLMETLDSIEQESGIFLIKPMYSYRSRDMVKERYAGKLSRPNRPRTNQSPARDVPSAYAPAPTPASNVRGGYKHHALPQPVPPEQLAIRNSTDPVRPLEGDDAGVMGSSLNWVGTSPRPVWNLNSSQVRGEVDVHGLNLSNTPRILELDINRMLIGQNTISSKIQQPGLTEDRLVNASQNNLRSYVTVNRPTASPSQHRNKTIGSKESVPPSSPAQYSPTGSAQKRVRMSDADFSRNLTNTPPLPPIPTGSAGSRSPDSDREQTSPLGSSLRHSPATNVIEVISPLK